MPLQTVQKRVKNFSEVTLGLSKKQAMEEAMRCPQPTNPEHVHTCPLGVDVYGFIRLIREGNITDACEKIREQNPLASVCGRVCHAPCEQTSFEGEQWSVPVRALERFAVEYGGRKESKKAKSSNQGHKIAVVGSGPAGLTAAVQLAKKGYTVTVFEAFHVSGGTLRYAVPELRLPRKILNEEIEYVKSFGVSVSTDALIGQTFGLQELLEKEYAAVLLAVGSGVPQLPGIPGENLKGVLLASEFLIRVNLMHAHFFPNYETSLPVGKKVVVIGGGADTLDVARLCIRLGKEVVLIYEGTEDGMDAQRQDIEFAKEEGVAFEAFAKPLQILGESDGRVNGVKCIRMDFADPTSSGKWKLTEVKGSEFTVSCDTAILSGIYKPNALLGKLTPDLKMKKDGTFFTKANSFSTSVPGVFASQNAPSIVESMALAKKAVLEIDKYLLSQPVKK